MKREGLNGAKKTQVGLTDVIGLAGFVMLGVGLWLMSPAVALVICGALLLILAVFVELRARL